MEDGEEPVYAYIVKSRSPREHGRWLYGDETNAQRFVESEIGTDVAWQRKSPGNWVARDGDRTWNIERVEIQDALGVVIQEPVTSPA